MRSSWLIAAGLTVALAAWLSSPYVLPAKEVPEAENDPVVRSDADAAMKVQTRLSSAEEVRRELVLNGRSQASRRVTLRAEIDGRVINLPLEKGVSVGAGALIAELDQRDKQAWVDRASAMLEEQRIGYEAARKLGQKGFQAETKVAQARAQLEEARATLEQSRLQLDHCSIEASFAGVLEDRLVEIGDFVQKGDAVAEIVELDPLIVKADIPEMHYHHISGDTLAEVVITGFGTRTGKVRYVASEADENTRTFEIEIELDNPDFALPAGISAAVELAFNNEPAHRISPSLLTLDDAGRVGVKIVDALGIVAFKPAQIIKSDADHVWLAGLPDDIEIITIGQGFVRPGQKVDAVREEQADNGGDDLIAKK